MTGRPQPASWDGLKNLTSPELGISLSHLDKLPFLKMALRQGIVDQTPVLKGW